ncbi:hypothetical protein [Pseudomonas capeferrum]|uniref:hypothetical protein n=1 Tax=Pseudomonas capeferrum TaxID=1495066 RepID=UPI0030D9F562
MNRVDTYSLLSQEGYLISSCLATGLTELRKADVHNKGAFYTALFNLSIGLERLLKVVLIIDYMLANSMEAPEKELLLPYRHNIVKLYGRCVEISIKRHNPLRPCGDLNSIDQEILRSLNKFADKSRYHNLDSLCSPTNRIDPLESWDNILVKVIETDVSSKRINKILCNARSVSTAIQDCTLVNMVGLSKKPLTLEGALAIPGLHEQGIRFVILRLVKFLAPIRDLLSDISEEAFYKNDSPSPAVPLMGEFLEWIWDDRNYVLRKRRWP